MLISFPIRPKLSQIKPIFKKGDERDTSNCRPISLFTSISKIFDKVIYNILYYHIKNTNILTKEQFGFRHSSSTNNASYL
jgi:hypothetical protein